MQISLKDQLRQVNKLNEIQYHSPVYNTDYYTSKVNVGYGTPNKEGVRMFYDFYAMEFLWSFLGSGSIPKSERKKWRDLDPDDSGRDVVASKSYKFLPHAAVKTIDDVYEQVTRAVAKQLISYIRMAVVQEFRYLPSCATAWIAFRNAVMSEYNKKNTISKSRFDELIRSHIPRMQKYPDTVKKLLKFSKYYSPMHVSGIDKDVYDVTRHSIKEPDIEEPISPEEPISTPEDADIDTTDYKSKPIKRKFGKYSPENPSPYEKPWSGLTAFNSDENESEKEADDDIDKLTEGLDPKKIRATNNAINNSGITLKDIEIAFNNINWAGAMGGKAWGAGAIALLKLMDAKKNMDTEDLNHIIDHIYDLQHNTGSLLNKGPMYVTDTDLNRRYKITNVARFIPYVSSLIKDLIIRYQKYLYEDPSKADAELEKNNIINSNAQPMSKEEEDFLSASGFVKQGNSWSANINSVDKKGHEIYGTYYKIKKCTNGKYLINDDLNSDIQMFDTFPEVQSYVKNFSRDIIKPEIPMKSPAVKSSYGHLPDNPKNTSITPTVYTNELPPHAISKTVYTVHTGIGYKPSPIRLTVEDENKLKEVGYHPKMISNSIWYIDSKDGSSVKFYPNNTSNYISASPAGSNDTNNNTVEGMIAWLQSGKPSTKSNLQSKSDGTKLSIMEPNVTKYGFKWNADINEYTDGNNNLIIHPNKSSDLYIPSVNSYHFNNLPALFAFLKNSYEGQKK